MSGGDEEERGTGTRDASLGLGLHCMPLVARRRQGGGTRLRACVHAHGQECGMHITTRSPPSNLQAPRPWSFLRRLPQAGRQGWCGMFVVPRASAGRPPLLLLLPLSVQQDSRSEVKTMRQTSWPKPSMASYLAQRKKHASAEGGGVARARVCGEVMGIHTS